MEAWQTAEDKMDGVTKVRMATENKQLRIIKSLQGKVEELQRDRPEIKSEISVRIIRHSGDGQKVNCI